MLTIGLVRSILSMIIGWLYFYEKIKVTRSKTVCLYPWFWVSLVQDNIDHTCFLHSQLGFDNFMYEGENCLNEYCVYDITMSIESVKNITIARIKIKIARRVEGLILTAFIPTLILNIIGHTSNYFKECFFEGLMALNVTVMLALTTMFLRYEMFFYYFYTT